MDTDPAFLFTDVEGSTRLWEDYPEQMGPALETHDGLLREAIEANSGRVFSTAGDAFAAQFSDSTAAVSAARDGQRGLAKNDWPNDLRLRVRMGVHAGPAQRRGGDFFGPTLNKAARIMAAGHGGQILTSAPALPEPLPEGLRSVDRGICRLKDIRDPEHLYQLSVDGLSDDFPALRTARTGGQLPRSATTLIGRETELQALHTALGESRHATLVGPPGVGKTRLALEVATQQGQQLDAGAHWVDLTGVDDPDRLEDLITRAVVGEEEPKGFRAIARVLGDATALVVIDNCEHLIDACATAVTALLDACPRLCVLCTSRQPLATEAEYVFELGPLRALAGGGTKAAWSPAAELFLVRARQSNRGVEFGAKERALTVQLCAALDGLPLAVEVAAGMLRTTPLETLAADAGGLRRRVLGGAQRGRRRHDTLRAALDWSVRGLSPEADEVLRRAAIFPDGWDVGAAAALCGDSLDEDRIWSGIHELHDRSLVATENQELVGRYTMLQPVREYALALNDQGFRDITSERLLRWAEVIVKAAGDELWGPNQTEWMDRLESDHENILAALRWALRDGHAPDAALSLATGLWPYWARAWPADAAVDLLQEALDASPDATPVALAAAWNGYATLKRVKGDQVNGQRAAMEALRLSRRAGDPAEEGQALFLEGQFLFQQERYDEATGRLDASLEAFHKANNEERAGAARNALGIVQHMEGNLSDARASYQEALAVAERCDAPGLRSTALVNLAEVDREEGRLAAALEVFTETLSAFEAIRDYTGVAHVLEQIAGVLNDLEDPVLGAQALGAAAQLREEVGAVVSPINARRLELDRRGIRHAVGHATAEAAFALGGRQGLAAFQLALSSRG